MKIGALYPSPEGKGFTANRDNGCKKEARGKREVIDVFF